MTDEYCREFERRKQSAFRIVAGLVGLLVGLAIGGLNYHLNVEPAQKDWEQYRVNWVIEAYTPKTAKIRDVNGDGIDDLIVKCEFNDFILLGEKNGTFKFLEERPSYWESQDKFGEK